MSVSTILAVSASVQAANAQQQAAEAKMLACATLMPAYEHRTATLEQAKQYADCVDRMHPNPPGGDVLVAAKVLVVALIAAFVWGAVRGWREDGAAGALLFGSTYALFAGAIALISALVACGVQFIFS